MTDHGGAASPRTEAARRFHANEHGAVCSFAATGSCALVNDGPWGEAWLTQIEAEAAQEAPAPEGLRAPLEASGFEPESNVCRGCGHDGGQHDLRNWCLVCPRPEVEIGPTDHSVDKRVAAGWCFFSSMSEDERWEHSVKRLRAALAATPPTPAEPPNLDYESEWYRKGWEAGRAATIADHILAQEAPAPEGRFIDSRPEIGALTETIELELGMHNEVNGECDCGDQLADETFWQHVAAAVDYRLTATDGDA